MAIILNRPMFRRGGSVAEGTGITSGLTPRANYADGPDEDGVQQSDVVDETLDTGDGVEQQVKIEDTSNIYKPTGSQTVSEKEKPQEQDKYVNQSIEKILEMVQNKLMPTDEEKVKDYLTAVGVAGAGDPTKLKTWGSFLGDAAKNYETLQEPKIKQAKQYGAQAALQVIKGMNKSSLTALMKNAQAGVDAGVYKDINEGVRKQLEAASYQKTPHPEVLKSKIVKGYEDDYKKANPSDVYASNKAQIDYQIKNEKSLPGGIKEEDLAGAKRYLNPNALTTSPDGKIIFNPKTINVGQQKAYAKEINKVFINPVTKKFYRFKGDHFEPIE
jgi:hypothetical protein